MKLEYSWMPSGYSALHLPLLLPNTALALTALSPTLQPEGATLCLCRRVCVCVCMSVYTLYVGKEEEILPGSLCAIEA